MDEIALIDIQPEDARALGEIDDMHETVARPDRAGQHRKPVRQVAEVAHHAVCQRAVEASDL